MAQFTFDELDELLNYTRFEADAAAHTARTSGNPHERDLAHERYGNATFLADKLLEARGPGGMRPAPYLLRGAEDYCYASMQANTYRPIQHLRLLA